MSSPMDLDTTTSKRKRSTDGFSTEEEKEREVRAKRVRTEEAISLRENLLQEMGVTQKDLDLLSRPLIELSDKEKNRLKGFNLDLWLACGACEVRIAVAEFWLSHKPPIYITDPTNHVVPNWATQDKRWYVLWWQNSPFTVPGETGYLGPTSTFLRERFHVERWIQHVWQPNRTGTPQCVIYEILISWDLVWSGLPHANLENCYNLFWLFSLLEGDYKKLALKIRFKDSSAQPSQPDETTKRGIPTTAMQLEKAVFNVVNRALKLHKKFIDREEGYGYSRFMTATRANNPRVSTDEKEMSVRLHLATGLRDAINGFMQNTERSGFTKIQMLLAFRERGKSDHDIIETVWDDLEARAYMASLPCMSRDEKIRLGLIRHFELDAGQVEMCVGEPQKQRMFSPLSSPLFRP